MPYNGRINLSLAHVLGNQILARTSIRNNSPPSPCPHESALILAGAGSGKTRVLTTRIAWLIQTGQVSPHGMLAVTFTNKAAREMLTRISAMLPINTRGMWVGTFHGLCNRLLRAHHRDAGLPQTFQILDSQDQLALIKRLMKALNVDDEKFPPRDLQYFINGNKEEGRRARRQVEVFDDRTQRQIEIYAEYDEQCQREGVVDFAELLLRCFELLSAQRSPAQALSATLHAHPGGRVSGHQPRCNIRWLKLLAGPDNAIFAVGDDDQSIYAFRGASSKTCSSSSATSPRAGSSSWSRTTAGTATSWTPPMR